MWKHRQCAIDEEPLMDSVSLYPCTQLTCSDIELKIFWWVFFSDEIPIWYDCILRSASLYNKAFLDFLCAPTKTIIFASLLISWDTLIQGTQWKTGLWKSNKCKEASFFNVCHMLWLMCNDHLWKAKATIWSSKCPSTNVLRTSTSITQSVTQPNFDFGTEQWSLCF